MSLSYVETIPSYLQNQYDAIVEWLNNYNTTNDFKDQFLELVWNMAAIKYNETTIWMLEYDMSDISKMPDLKSKWWEAIDYNKAINNVDEETTCKL